MLDKNGKVYSSQFFFLKHIYVSLSTPVLFVQGTQGCKNIKLGGDTVHGESSEGWNVFMTYFVYRSLKFPPGDKRQQ